MCPFVRPRTRGCRALRTPYSCGTRPQGQSCLRVCLGARSSICQGRWRHTLWEDWKALRPLCRLLPHSLQPPENHRGIHSCAEPARAHHSLHLGEKEACYQQLACEPSGRSCGLGTPCAMPSQNQEGLGALALLSSPSVGRTTASPWGKSCPVSSTYPAGLPWAPARPRFPLAGLTQIHGATGAVPFVLAFWQADIPWQPEC